MNVQHRQVHEKPTGSRRPQQVDQLLGTLGFLLLTSPERVGFLDGKEALYGKADRVLGRLSRALRWLRSFASS